MRSPFARVAAHAAAVAGLLLGAPGSAAAAPSTEPGVLVSLDGVHFSVVPDGSLFPADYTLVPGSRVTTTIHVRNASPHPGDLRIAVTDVGSSRARFIETLNMQASTASTPPGAPVPLQLGEVCTPILAGESIPAGGTVSVNITLGMDAAAGNREQAATADAALHVSLTEPDAPSTAAASCTPGTGIPVARDPRSPAKPDPAEDSGHIEDEAPPAEASGSGSPSAPPGAEPAPPVDTPSAVDTPPAAGAQYTGYGLPPVLYPWLGVAAPVLGVVFFFVSRHRRKQAG